MCWESRPEKSGEGLEKSWEVWEAGLKMEGLGPGTWIGAGNLPGTLCCWQRRPEEGLTGAWEAHPKSSKRDAATGSKVGYLILRVT